MTIRLEWWSVSDEPLLRALVGDPAMMAHLGGPETPAQISARHARYLASPAGEPQFRIVDGADALGWVGYWRRDWRGREVDEIGWSVLPAAQGRGVATRAAILAAAHWRAHGELTEIHAFPDVGHGASNAVCARAGFTLAGEVAFDYPPGAAIRVNDWRQEIFRVAP